MYDLEHLSLRQMTECGAVLRALHEDADSMEEVCRRAVRYLFELGFGSILPFTTGPTCAVQRA